MASPNQACAVVELARIKLLPTLPKPPLSSEPSIKRARNAHAMVEPTS